MNRNIILKLFIGIFLLFNCKTKRSNKSPDIRKNKIIIRNKSSGTKLNTEDNYLDNLKDIFKGPLSIPKGIKPITDFNLNEYLGTWYEVVRLDHSFERNLIDVSANYKLDEKGNIIVFNQGIKTINGVRKQVQAHGIAKPVGNKNLGHLKVSFFKPFYGSYLIFHIEKDDREGEYKFAIVTGSNKKYLWVLSRTKRINKNKLKELINIIKKKGYKTENLIYNPCIEIIN